MSTRRPQHPDNVAWMVMFGLVAGALGSVWAVRQLASWAETGQWLTGPDSNPVAMGKSVLTGKIHWTGTHIIIGVIFALILLAVGFWVMSKIAANTRYKRSIEYKARKLGSGMDLSYKAAQAKADKGGWASEDIAPGLLLARTMYKARKLYSAWREGLIIIMGPGGGKTTGFATPMILEAPGVVFATSNKRDISDQVRAARSRKGMFWCFDPQSIAAYHQGSPSWWWNILSYVRDETRALALATMFASTAKSGKKIGGTETDFFEAAGKHLLARMLLAAAVSGRYVDQVFLWLSEENEREPVKLLEKAGFKMAAKGLDHTYNSPPEQRGGVFATARGFVEFLENKAALQWITPLGPDDDRVQFDHVAFVRSTGDTMIALSKEGDGSLGPVTAALTKAILDSAEEFAMECGGRVTTPITGVLDEAANCAPIPDLPQKYSFYGSMGIQVVTILQTPHQGVAVWGETGWKQLWDASTIRVVGSGVKDMTFLRDLAAHGGKHDKTRWNISSGRGQGGYSTTSNTTREDILDPSDLANLKPGQVYVVHNNGSAPVLANTVPYWERPEISGEVTMSVNTYGPAAKIKVPA